MGCCALRHPAVAGVVQETLLHFDGERYRLLAWCIMPNHVHVLMDPQAALGKIVQSWKSYTGRWAMEKNAELGLGVPGEFYLGGIMSMMSAAGRLLRMSWAMVRM
jgi:putative transposase